MQPQQLARNGRTSPAAVRCTRPAADTHSLPVLSVIIPVYNESAMVLEILARVQRMPIEKEILIVDDGSTDGTRELLSEVAGKGITVILHETNRGKGAAIRTALPYAKGTVVIMQDADLEYDPRDYPELIRAIHEGDGVVYGTRYGHPLDKGPYTRYRLGGMLLSRLANLLYGLHISDVMTGYKAFALELIKSMHLQSDGFDFEPEVTAKVAKRNIAITEVPIRYHPRTFREGKKIRWIDGVKAAWALLKYRFVD